MLKWLAQAFEDFKEFLYSLVLTIGDMFKDIFMWLFEQFMDITILALSGLGSLFDGLNIANHINSIPPAAKYFASSSGLGEAMGMIVSALTIRFLLQLIPFTRLGS